MFSKEHANFILNLGGASAEDILKLIKLAKREVKKKFGVQLKEEIVLVGEF
jgi:UDP-N-acetylmuramate dehydrogenase